MFDYLTRLSMETGMDGRKAKREARAKAYWLGHSMGPFHGSVSTCKTCDMTMKLSVDGVSGDAVEKHCTQQLIPEITRGEKNNA